MSSWCDNHIRFIHRLLFRKAKFLQRVNEFVCLSPFSFFLKIVKLLEAMFVYSFPSLFSSSSIYLCYLPTIVLFKKLFPILILPTGEHPWVPSVKKSLCFPSLKFLKIWNASQFRIKIDHPRERIDGCQVG